jgi:hypothetical protein
MKRMVSSMKSWPIPRLWRLIVLVAVLMMPFGMTAAPASTPNRAIEAEMPMGHCLDQGSGHGSKHGLAECTMACAAALPASDARVNHPLVMVSEHIRPKTSARLHGLHPKIATPPPRLA